MRRGGSICRGQLGIGTTRCWGSSPGWGPQSNPVLRRPLLANLCAPQPQPGTSRPGFRAPPSRAPGQRNWEEEEPCASTHDFRGGLRHQLCPPTQTLALGVKACTHVLFMLGQTGTAAQPCCSPRSFRPLPDQLIVRKIPH